jgi:hypothetical protein
MTQEQELDALNNGAMGLGLKVLLMHYKDKQKKERYFAVLNGTNRRFSPVLNYDQMNHFLLGFRRASNY